MFNTRALTISMPLDKIQDSIGFLDSDDFTDHQKASRIGPCGMMRGKICWAAYTISLGEIPCLINIEKDSTNNQVSQALRR